MGQPPWCSLCRCVPPCSPTDLWPNFPMTADISFTKRAAAELSRCFNGLTVRGKAGSVPCKDKIPPGPTTATVAPKCVEKRRSSRQEKSSRVRNYVLSIPKPRTLEELWHDPLFLSKFFLYFCSKDRATLAQVCVSWKDILYRPRYFRGILPVLRCRDLRSTNSNDQSDLRRRVYSSLQQRGFDCICLFGANDTDVFDFVSNCPSNYIQHIRFLSMRCCNVTDRGLEVMLSNLQAIAQLELSGCNEITDAGLWASLTPRLGSLTVADCINIADNTVAAITQLLPMLYELNLQAYHVTDAALAFFGPRQSNTLCTLRLRSCWELTNHGVLNLVHGLPNLTVLSLSGCSKISDDGVELLAEKLRQLRSLDLSWCPRISDGALEYIACDLSLLEELVLDRCAHITDIGLGYLSTMANLSAIYLRWCSQIRDYGIKHLCNTRNLQILSLAGCPLLSSSGLSSLVQLRHLKELELTNCPGASKELYEYLHENLPECVIMD